MSEPSVEATVAGEAAAAAVEEVQSREAIVESVQETSILAEVALTEAANANDTASMAGSEALVANERATQAAVEAEEAQAQTAQVAYMTADMFEALRAENDEKMRQMREYVDSRVPLPVKTGDDGVEEISADGTAGVSDSGQSESDGDGAPEKQSAPRPREERYGLRHRRR
jgi:hypothetical protein